MNEVMTEQQLQQFSCEAVSIAHEVSDEILEAAGDRSGLVLGTRFPTMGWGCCA